MYLCSCQIVPVSISSNICKATKAKPMPADLYIHILTEETKVPHYYIHTSCQSWRLMFYPLKRVKWTPVQFGKGGTFFVHPVAQRPSTRGLIPDRCTRSSFYRKHLRSLPKEKQWRHAPGFIFRRVNVEFIIDIVSVGQVFLWILGHSHFIIIPPMLHALSFTYYLRDVIGNVVK